MDCFYLKSEVIVSDPIPLTLFVLRKLFLLTWFRKSPTSVSPFILYVPPSSAVPVLACGWPPLVMISGRFLIEARINPVADARATGNVGGFLQPKAKISRNFVSMLYSFTDWFPGT